MISSNIVYVGSLGRGLRTRVPFCSKEDMTLSPTPRDLLVLPRKLPADRMPPPRPSTGTVPCRWSRLPGCSTRPAPAGGAQDRTKSRSAPGPCHRHLQGPTSGMCAAHLCDLGLCWISGPGSARAERMGMLPPGDGVKIPLKLKLPASGDLRPTDQKGRVTLPGVGVAGDSDGP